MVTPKIPQNSLYTCNSPTLSSPPLLTCFKSTSEFYDVKLPEVDSAVDLEIDWSSEYTLTSINETKSKLEALESTIAFPDGCEEDEFSLNLSGLFEPFLISSTPKTSRTVFKESQNKNSPLSQSSSRSLNPFLVSPVINERKRKYVEDDDTLHQLDILLKDLNQIEASGSEAENTKVCLSLSPREKMNLVQSTMQLDKNSDTHKLRTKENSTLPCGKPVLSIRDPGYSPLSNKDNQQKLSKDNRTDNKGSVVTTESFKRFPVQPFTKSDNVPKDYGPINTKLSSVNSPSPVLCAKLKRNDSIPKPNDTAPKTGLKPTCINSNQRPRWQ